MPVPRRKGKEKEATTLKTMTETVNHTTFIATLTAPPSSSRSVAVRRPQTA